MVNVIAPIPVSEYIDAEIISTTANNSTTPIPTQNSVALQRPLPIFLPDRRIYLYLEALVSGAGAFSLFTDVVLYNKGTVVGVMGCKLCDFTNLTPNQSAPRLFNSGGSPVGDSLVLTLAQPFNASITTVTVQPLRINAQADEIRLLITGVNVGTMQGYRAYLGVLSSANS